ncbi:hypothetical protein YC2023_091285 [Brassica napus]
MTLASQKFLLVSQNYHPLEELKPGKRVQETKLSPAEVARTAVEVYALAEEEGGRSKKTTKTRWPTPGVKKPPVKHEKTVWNLKRKEQNLIAAMKISNKNLRHCNFRPNSPSISSTSEMLKSHKLLRISSSSSSQKIL